MLGLLFALTSRGASIGITIVVSFFIFHKYGAIDAGKYGVMQGISAALLSALSMGVPRLAAVRFKKYSEAFLSCSLLSAGVFSALIYILIILAVYGPSVLSMAGGIFLVKLLEFYVELDSVFYRKRNLEKILMATQLARVLGVVLVIFLVSLVTVNVDEFLFALFGIFLIMFVVDQVVLLKKRYLRWMGYSFSFYIRLFGHAKHNCLGHFLSAFISTMPRYAVTYLLGAAAAGVYLLLSYTYVALTIFWSIVMQTVIIKRKKDSDFFALYRNLFRKIVLIYVAIIPLTWSVCHYLGVYIFDSEVAIYKPEIVVTILVASSICMVLRELTLYSLLKKNKVTLVNYANLIVISLFALGIFILSRLDGFASISAVVLVFFLSNLFGLAVLIRKSSRIMHH